MSLLAQNIHPGTISGSTVDKVNNHPLELVNVVLHARIDSALATGKVTDTEGKFKIDDVKSGEYFVTFSLIGYRPKTTPAFTIDSTHKHLNLGTIGQSRPPS